MGGKQQSYWTVHYKYPSLSSHMWCSIEITWPSCGDQKQYGVFPSAGHLYRGYLRCHRFFKQFSHFTLSSPAVDKPDRHLTNLTTSDQLPTNLANFWPTFDQLNQFLTKLLTNLTNFWPICLFFLPTWPSWSIIDQLLTNFWPILLIPDQFFTNLTNFVNFRPTRPTWPMFDQLDRFLTNLTHFCLTRPTFDQVDNWPIFDQFNLIVQFLINLWPTWQIWPAWPTFDQLLTDLTNP